MTTFELSDHRLARNHEPRRKASVPLSLGVLVLSREEIMKRLALLFFSGWALTGAVAGTDLSHCLDPATKLDAGGDVSDKELAAARQACAQLQQSESDEGARRRIDHAASTIKDEQQHRQASHH